MRRMLRQRQTKTVRLVIIQADMKAYKVHNHFDEYHACHNAPIEQFEKTRSRWVSVPIRPPEQLNPLLRRPPAWPLSWCRRRPGAKSPWIFRQRGNSPAALPYLHMRPAKRHHIKSTPETTHKDSQVTTIVAMRRTHPVKCGVLLTAIAAVIPPKGVLY